MDFEHNVETKDKRLSNKTASKLREKDQHIPSNMSVLDSSTTPEM